ncbi:RICIN domain-containing protein [Streptomyces sp. NPDC029674]|uniref:RICIN domain-containing protein n=1 Tax=Streptomyces sp. NPDC029674 TaxID=3365297 RepID=UPI00384ED562
MMKTKALLGVTLAGAGLLSMTSPAVSAAEAPVRTSATSATSSAAAARGITGVHYIQPAHAPGKCVTAHAWDTSTRAKINQWTCQGQRNQRWNFMENSVRHWIKSESSNKCLDGADMSKGVKVLQWRCKSSLNQAWSVIPRGGNTFSIQVGTQCLDVEGGSRSNGARLILWKCKNVKNQRFHLR